MHILANALAILTSVLALGWLWQVLAALRGVPTLPDLAAVTTTLPDLPSLQTPHLTVIVPACNEEESIEKTLRSLLASMGLRLQIVAIDDRSTDRTGDRMDSVAAEASSLPSPHSLEVIHVRELPAGWLGKTHAMALGADRASSPWLLFTDADVTFAPRAAALALHYATREQADHVVLALTLDFKHIFEAAVFAAFQALAQWNIRLWKVADPRARDFFGAGGFNLVRRDVYEQVGGFRSMPMEVVEDLRLGWKIKRAGFAQRVVLGAGLARIRWIKGAFGVVGLLEKNGFAGFRYRIALALLASLSFVAQIVLPLAAIACGGWAAVAGYITYVLIALAYWANRRITQVSPWLAIFFAPATAILVFAVVRSVCLTLARGGVVWRGTRYSLDELRRNAGPGWF